MVTHHEVHFGPPDVPSKNKIVFKKQFRLFYLFFCEVKMLLKYVWSIITVFHNLSTTGTVTFCARSQSIKGTRGSWDHFAYSKYNTIGVGFGSWPTAEFQFWPSNEKNLGTPVLHYAFIAHYSFELWQYTATGCEHSWSCSAGWSCGCGDGYHGWLNLRCYGYSHGSCTMNPIIGLQSKPCILANRFTQHQWKNIYICGWTFVDYKYLSPINTSIHRLNWCLQRQRKKRRTTGRMVYNDWVIQCDINLSSPNLPNLWVSAHNTPGLPYKLSDFKSCWVRRNRTNFAKLCDDKFQIIHAFCKIRL